MKGREQSLARPIIMIKYYKNCKTVHMSQTRAGAGWSKVAATRRGRGAGRRGRGTSKGARGQRQRRRGIARRQRSASKMRAWAAAWAPSQTSPHTLMRARAGGGSGAGQRPEALQGGGSWRQTNEPAHAHGSVCGWYRRRHGASQGGGGGWHQK